MLPFRAMLRGSFPITIILLQSVIAHGQQTPSGGPTLQVTSGLVTLDVTVLDKKDRPVMKGLTPADFAITEDEHPQSINSFEAPEAHVMGAGAGDGNSAGMAPATIFVLDLLNTSVADFDYIRYQVRGYLTG
jgi:VWFA-related protein